MTKSGYEILKDLVKAGGCLPTNIIKATYGLTQEQLVDILADLIQHSFLARGPEVICITTEGKDYLNQ